MKRSLMLLSLFSLHLIAVVTPIDDEAIIASLHPCTGDELKVVRIPLQLNTTSIRLIPLSTDHRNYVAHIHTPSKKNHYFQISCNEDAQNLAQLTAQEGNYLNWYYLNTDDASAKID